MSPAHHTDVRLPNFLYLGPSKAGSTWLHEVLIRHPQVFMPDAKDLYFFDRYFDRGVDWYAGHFRDAGAGASIVGEVCQEYLSSREAPRRIRDVLGSDLRMMVTLRDPVARAFSGYLYMQKHGVFNGTFREAIETRPGMIEHNRYATLLENYYECFDPANIYIGLFDDLGEDPQAFVSGLLKWLGIDPMELDETLLAVRLPASRARSKRLAMAVKNGANWARQHTPTANLIGRIKRSARVHQLLYVPFVDDKPTPLPEDAAYLRERLLPEVIRLEKLVDLPLRERWDWPKST